MLDEQALAVAKREGCRSISDFIRIALRHS
jgi:hypothetical protein